MKSRFGGRTGKYKGLFLLVFQDVSETSSIGLILFTDFSYLKTQPEEYSW